MVVRWTSTTDETLCRKSYNRYHSELLPRRDGTHTPPAEGVHIRPESALSIEETLVWAAGVIALGMSLRDGSTLAPRD